VQFANPTPSAR
jgi:hypothetical protein